jgi:hypothetical protein
MVWERRDETMSQCMFFWFVVVVVSCMNNSTGGSSRPVANCLDTTFWVVHLFQTPLSHHHHLIISAGAFTHYTDDDSTLLKSSSTAWLSFLFRLGENCCLLPACTCVSSLPLFLSFFFAPVKTHLLNWMEGCVVVVVFVDFLSTYWNRTTASTCAPFYKIISFSHEMMIILTFQVTSKCGWIESRRHILYRTPMHYVSSYYSNFQVNLHSFILPICLSTRRVSVCVCFFFKPKN